MWKYFLLAYACIFAWHVLSGRDAPEMALVTTVDSEGGTLTTFEYDGFHFPPFPGIEERVRKLPNFEAREDDILVCSYPRSGTNWILEILWMLRQESTERTPFTNNDTNLCLTEGQLLDALPSPRILNTHLIPKLVPIDFFRKKSKLIQVRRNSKDVMVSFYNMGKQLQIYTGGNFAGVVERVCGIDNDAAVYGSWFGHVKDWERTFKTLDSDNNYLVLYYEDMKRDLLSHVTTVADFLGWEISEDLCRDIAEHCSFKMMKDGKNNLPHKDGDIFFQNGESILYRKGEVGDWKNYFTVAQSEQYDAKYEREMKGLEYLKFEYDS